VHFNRENILNIGNRTDIIIIAVALFDQAISEFILNLQTK